MKFSIVVAGLEDEVSTDRLLSAYLPYFQARFQETCEVLVVVRENATVVATLGKLQKSYPALRSITLPATTSPSELILHGLSESSGDRVCCVDPMAVVPPQTLETLVCNDDVVAAAGPGCGPGLEASSMHLGSVVSWAYALAVRLLFGLSLPGYCLAVAAGRKALEPVLNRLGSTDLAFFVHLLFELKREGVRCRTASPGSSDVNHCRSGVVPAAVESFGALVRLRLLYSPFRWMATAYDKHLAPLIHPAGVQSDQLLRHSLLLLSGSQICNVLNLLLQIAMIRMLATEQFGIMAAMLGMFGILRTPVGAIGPTFSHYAARLIRQSDPGRLKTLVFRLLRHLTVVGVPALLLMVVFRGSFASFFNLESTAPIVVMSFCLLGVLYNPVFGGVLTGAQAFVLTSVISIVGCLLNLLLSVGFVALGWLAMGALVGYALSFWSTILLRILGVRRLLHDACASQSADMTGLYAYYVRIVVALFCVTFLSTADVVLVKHYFDATSAGYFSKAAVIARILIVLPMPIVQAMFPKVASSGKASSASRRTLAKAVVVTGVVVVSLAFVFTLFPRVIVALFRREPSPFLFPLLRGMIWALCPLPIVRVIANYELAQRRFFIAVPLALLTGAYVLGVAVWHETLWHVIRVLGATSWSALVASVLCLRWKLLRPQNSRQAVA